MYTEFEAGGRTYQLRLTTHGCIQLEKKLGANPLQLFMGIDDDVLPKLSDILIVLHAVLQPLNHGITFEDVCGIYDDYIAEGHTLWDLIPLLIEVFKGAGFLEKGDADPKN